MTLPERAFETIREFAVSELQADASKLTVASELDDLGLDSLDRVNLIVALEKSLGKDLPALDFENCVSVDDVIQIAIR